MWLRLWLFSTVYSASDHILRRPGDEIAESQNEYNSTITSSIGTMKRNRIQFEDNGDQPSDSPPQGVGAAPEDDSRQGGRHVPKISRRIRACTECKKHKVRCDMGPGDTTCQRCRRMNLECVVNKSLQTLLEDETEYTYPILFLLILRH